jgi:hypothetical protein
VGFSLVACHHGTGRRARPDTTRYPRTRAVVLFDNPADQTLPGAVIDWSIGHNPDVLAVFRGHAEAGVFVQP